MRQLFRIFSNIAIYIALSFFILPMFLAQPEAQGRKVTWEKFEWQVLSSKFFDIHYPKGYEEMGRLALVYAEEANIFLSEAMAHKLSEVIPIYIYPSHRHFQMTNIYAGAIDESIGGFTESQRKRVVIPFMGSYDKLRHVITHELVHAFQYDILMEPVTFSAPRINTPLWLIEGMAEYLSIAWDSSGEMAMRDAVVSGTLPTIEELTYMQVANSYMIYKAGQSIAHYIDETYGLHKIGELLKDTRDQERFTDAVKTNLGISSAELNEEWQLWLKRKYFADIQKKIDNEQAHIVTDSPEEYSVGANMHPAISPDGTKMVYLTFRKYQPALVIKKADLEKGERDYTISGGRFERDKGGGETVLVTGGDNAGFRTLHYLDNRISFTPDSKNIFFCAQSRGKDRLFLFDVEKKKVVESWAPAVDTIQYPKLSVDGKRAVFTGLAYGRANLYVLDLESGEVEQITDNYFYEKQASFSHDAKMIYFSSNMNQAGDIESPAYHIFSFDLASKKIVQLTFEPGDQLNPFPAGESGDTLLYVSGQTGILNAYSLDLSSGKSRQLTDAAGGILQAQVDQKDEVYLFSFYRKQRYDIGLIEKAKLPEAKQREQIGERLRPPAFPKAPDDLSIVPETSYFPKFSLDRFLFGLQYSSYYGAGGFVYIILNEYMGNHSIEAFIDAASASENYLVKYAYIQNRIDFYFTGFRTTNYYSILNLTDLYTLNDFLYNPNFVASSIYREGVNMTATYPFHSFFGLDLGIEVSRMEETFYDEVPAQYERKDIKTNIYGINAGISYNNVLYSYAGPLKGTSVRLNDAQTLNLSGADYVFNRVELDFRKYFLLGNRSVFASRVFMGVSSGPQGSYFPFLLGGYNTLRGHPFLSIQGRHAFLTKMELRFPLIDYIIFGLPFQWASRGFSGVAFFDMGGAINNPNKWRGYDNETGRLDDLKMSFGLGMRVVVFPGFLLKIDWGTPWDLVESLPLRRWQGVFSVGYEY